MEEQLVVLHASAQRLTATPVEELPRIAHFLASSVSSCKIALQASSNKSSDNTLPVHKLKTRLSSLLHDKTVSGRFTAAVVIKAYVETASANGPEWESWLRTLIGCLNKPDPWQVKKVFLSTIVRILLLCQHSPQLQREVSTPHLPAFITATLTIIRPSSRQSGSKTRTTTSPLLLSVFHCWTELLQHYGNTIRPFVSRIKPICLSVLSESGQASSLQDLAAQVLASLCRCSPKNAVQGEWDSSFRLLIKTAHDTLDLVFRGVREDRAPADLASSRPNIRHNYSQPPLTETHDPAGLLPWKGIRDGTQRVINLFRWMEKMVHSSSQPATVPIGELVDLLTRVFSVIIPDVKKHLPRLNAEVGKEEREELWSSLPELHVAGLRLSKNLPSIFGQVLFSTFPTLSNQVLDLFLAEKWHANIRLQSYVFWTALIQISPFACTQVDRQTFNDLCKSCCLDLGGLITQQDQNQQTNDNALRTAAATTGSKSTLSHYSSQHRQRSRSALSQAAEELLAALLDQTPATVFSAQARTELDRTAILLNDERALYASVLNPPATRPGQRPTPSLIPFLARTSAGRSLAVEALIRPRMPLISAPAVQAPVTGDDEGDDNDDDEKVVDDMVVTEDSSNHHAPLGKNTEQTPTTTTATSISHNAVTDSLESTLHKGNHINITIQGSEHKESDTLTKRDFTTMQGGPTSGIAVDQHQQQEHDHAQDPLSKKPRNDPPQTETTTTTTTTTETDTTSTAAPIRLVEEDIKIYSNPAATITAHRNGGGGSSSSHYLEIDDVAGDDSDDSEIPTLDMTMAIGFEEEEGDDDGDDDGDDGDAK